MTLVFYAMSKSSFSLPSGLRQGISARHSWVSLPTALRSGTMTFARRKARVCFCLSQRHYAKTALLRSFSDPCCHSGLINESCQQVCTRTAKNYQNLSKQVQFEQQVLDQ